MQDVWQAVHEAGSWFASGAWLQAWSWLKSGDWLQSGYWREAGPWAARIVEIVWINVVLSGDNAVVIALACRGLPADKRRLGIVLGAGVAVALRIVFTVAIAALLRTPYVKIVGALLLVWIAVRLTADEDETKDVAESSRLWAAVRTVAVADAVMSLDNVLAIAAAARDSIVLLVIGLTISIPVVVAGAGLIASVLQKLPILVWAGAALLGWVAGTMLVSDPFLRSRFGEDRMEALSLPAAAAGAVLVLAAALGWRLVQRLTARWRRRSEGQKAGRDPREAGDHDRAGHKRDDVGHDRP